MKRAIYLDGPGTSDSPIRGLVPDAAIRGDMLFTGGVAGFAPDGSLPDSNEEQAANIYERVGRILAAAGFSTGDIGHWFVWAKDRHTKISPVNPHWERTFPSPQSRPARHALARALDPGMHYRCEIIAVKGAPRTSYEINDTVYHTGGTAIAGFIPYGTTIGNIMFTGPTYGMINGTRKMGVDGYAQAKLVSERNGELYALSDLTNDNIAQIFVWWHDEDSRQGAVRELSELFPNPNDRPAIHYIYSALPYWKELEAQFLVQHDIIAVRGAKRKIIAPAGITPMDGAGGTIPPGVAMGNLLFTSALLGHTPGSSALPASLEDQVTNAFAHARTVVEAGGFGVSDIGHVYVWYGDHALRPTVDRVWERVFPNPDERPARHCVLADVPAGAQVAVEVTAAR